MKRSSDTSVIGTASFLEIKMAFNRNPVSGNVVCDNCGGDLRQVGEHWGHVDSNEVCVTPIPESLHASRENALRVVSIKLGLHGDLTPDVFRVLGLLEFDPLMAEAEKEAAVVSGYYRSVKAVPTRQELAGWALAESEGILDNVGVPDDQDAEALAEYAEALERWSIKLRGE